MAVHLVGSCFTNPLTPIVPLCATTLQSMIPNVLAFEHGFQVNEYGNINEVHVKKG